MTAQEIFNKSYLGLKAQGRKSVDDIGDCLYCGPDGLHCGIGFLVSDDVGAHWDNLSTSNAISDILAEDGQEPIGVESWMFKNARLLDKIQCEHDEIEVWDDPSFGFEARFARLADRFGFAIPQVSV